RDGRFLDILGTYNPLMEPIELRLKIDRVEYWLGNGAQMSDTVASLVRKARRNPEMLTPFKPKKTFRAKPVQNKVEGAEVKAAEPKAEAAAEAPAAEAAPAQEEAADPKVEAAAEASAPEEAEENAAEVAEETATDEG
ncbi:MAG: 30S ribosomal protein S16, partial [Myxococcota bacterium]